MRPRNYLQPHKIYSKVTFKVSRKCWILKKNNNKFEIGDNEIASPLTDYNTSDKRKAALAAFKQ